MEEVARQEERVAQDRQQQQQQGAGGAWTHPQSKGATSLLRIQQEEEYIQAVEDLQQEDVKVQIKQQQQQQQLPGWKRYCIKGKGRGWWGHRDQMGNGIKQ